MTLMTTPFVPTRLRTSIMATTIVVSAALLLIGCNGNSQPSTTENKVNQTPDVTTPVNQPEVVTPPMVNTASSSSTPSIVDTTATAKPTTDDVNDANEANDGLSAQDVTLSTRALDYQLPNAVTDVCSTQPSDSEMECPDFKIELAEIQPKWIEEIVNAKITEVQNGDYTTLEDQLDADAMVQIESGSPWAYIVHTTPSLIEPHNNVAQFSVFTETYYGGAHGMYTNDYLLFDMDTQSELSLADVLTEPDVFRNLAYQVFHDYLQTVMGLTTPEEIASYELSFPFELTDNFYFTDNGLTLVYQPYEIGSFSQGFIELTVPNAELQHVVKPVYLP